MKEFNKKVNIEEVKKYLYLKLDQLNVTDEMYDVFSTIIDDMYNDFTEEEAIAELRKITELRNKK
ncbi:MAG: hypothetical protein VZS44_10525 [Bacilli bacterium]|nr:hypothetical protein [Bacilli bacterium]